MRSFRRRPTAEQTALVELRAECEQLRRERNDAVLELRGETERHTRARRFLSERADELSQAYKLNRQLHDKVANLETQLAAAPATDDPMLPAVEPEPRPHIHRSCAMAASRICVHCRPELGWSVDAFLPGAHQRRQTTTPAERTSP
jgi:seryl-tRNA synthetase